MLRFAIYTELYGCAMDWHNAKGWLTPKERELLHKKAAQTRSDAVFLNIGVEFGASVVCLRAGNPTAKIFAVDIIGDEKLATPVEAEFIKADSGYMAWETPLDLLFIDGDHSYEGVLRDCQLTDYVVLGGMVLFHDCYELSAGKRPHPVCPEVNNAVGVWHDPAQWIEVKGADSIRAFWRVA